MKRIFILALLIIGNLHAGWMNVDSMNVKQKWRNKKFNTDALLYVKSADSLLDTCNIYYNSGSNYLSIGGAGGYPFHVYGNSVFEDDLQTFKHFTADEGIESNQNLYTADTLTIHSGSERLRLFGAKGAAASATTYSEIATTNTYAGLDNNSLTLQAGSSNDNQSIAFIGGTGGKLTVQIYDTTIFQTFTDSNYFAGTTEFNTLNVDNINSNGATLNILGDSTFVNGKLEVGGTAGPLLTVKSTTTGTPTSFLYADASGGQIGTITNHNFIFNTNNTSRLILTTDGVLRTNGNEINYNGTDGQGLYFESDNDGVFAQQLGVVASPGSIDETQITSTGRTFLSVSDADNWSSLTLATDRAVSNGDLLSMIMFGATNETAGHGIKANIRCYADGSTAGEEGGLIDFQTKPDAGNMTSRMVIDENGDVGIGTSNPNGEKLVIYDSIAGNTTLLRGKNPQSDGGARAIIQGGTVSTTLESFGATFASSGVRQSEASLIQANGANGLWINTNNAGGEIILATGGSSTINERLRIKNTGFVGIGTSSPSCQLEVNGTINTDSLYVSGKSYFTNQSLYEGTEGGIVLNRTGGTSYLTYQDGSAINQWIFRHQNTDNEMQIYSAGIDGVFNVKQNATSVPALSVHTDNNDVGIGTSTPDAKLTIAEGPDTIKIDAIQWGCIAYTSGSFTGGVSDPDMAPVGGTVLYQPHFAGIATLEEVHGVMKVPSDALPNDTLFLATRAAPATTGAGNYRFHFYYSIINNTGTTTITTIDDSLMATTAASGTAYEFTSIELGYIVGLNPNDCIMFRFFRDPADAADTYGSDVVCIGAGFKYRINCLGQLTK